MSIPYAAACAAAIILSIASSAASADAGAQAPPSAQTTVVVTGQRAANSRYQVPSKIESITAQDAAERVNVVNTEDMLKYLPSILVRKRHIGDTQDPITTRTSGVGSSARSLIYADGVLLSTLIGNNNSAASPHWGLVAPEEIVRIDVMYGPFAAQYPGNSVGAVVEITTRMPEGFEVNAKASGAVQSFSQYATEDSYAAYQASAGLGDRTGAFAWRIGVNHLDSHGQPLAYVTLTRPATPSGAGLAATGAFADRNRTGAAIAVVGAGGLEHQIQDNATLKLAYDIAKNLRLSYVFALFNQRNDADVESYLRDSGGNPIYSGSVNIAGFNYSIGAGSFSNNIYRTTQTHFTHALTLKTSNGGKWDWEAIATLYDYGKDTQRIPGTALSAAFTGGAGTITKMEGTGWYTGDAKAIWRIAPNHELSFGAHYDRITLGNLRYNTANWISGPPAALASAARGKTETVAAWLQDVWHPAPDLKATIGARFEHWRAFDGLNYSLSPALNTAQPELSGSFMSPKASLAWQPLKTWTLSASYGRAYRMPTVGELYQAITTGATLSVPNPNLRPERADSYELSLEHESANGRLRLSLFQENLTNALISQSAPLVSGSPTLFNFVQNIDRVQSRGAELVIDRRDVVIAGLDLSGSVTYVDSRILKDAAFAPAVGKQTPQIPEWRVSAIATYRPNDRLSLSLAARYSDRVYATIDNSDIVTHTYQGFDGYFVMDARAHYAINDHWSAAFGIDNLNDRKYFLFHPFPQRTFQLELKYAV